MNGTDSGLMDKWKTLIDLVGIKPVTDNHRRMTVATLMENQERKSVEQQWNFIPDKKRVRLTDVSAGMEMEESDILNMARKIIDGVARCGIEDLVGVQPATGPTGMVFLMRTIREDGDFSGERFSGCDIVSVAVTAKVGESTIEVEDIGTGGNELIGGTLITGGDPYWIDEITGNNIIISPALNRAVGRGENLALIRAGDDIPNMSGPMREDKDVPEMSFRIESDEVRPRERSLNAECSLDLQKTLKEKFGIDAVAEMVNIMSDEVATEIGRNIIRDINRRAKPGSVRGRLDISGKTVREQADDIIAQIGYESSRIAKDTCRGKGNMAICSRGVIHDILDRSGMIEDRQIRDDGNGMVETGYCGTLEMTRTRLYSDPYSIDDYITVGYKGLSQYDTGIVWSPYVPVIVSLRDDCLTVKTSYDLSANPFAESREDGDHRYGTSGTGANDYYRRFTLNM